MPEVKAAVPAPADSVFLASAPPRVLAHRGLALDAPENTLLAFLKALANGATHIETDVHASLDGVAILSHGPDLAFRGRTVRIDQLTLAELKRIPLGDGAQYATLREALEAFPHALFNLDVKVESAAVPTAQAVIAAEATHRVLITSFSEERRRRATALLPGVATSPSSIVFLKAFLAATLGWDGLTRRILHGFVAVQVPERVGILRVVTPRIIRAMHRLGIEIHVWTVNEPAVMSRLLTLGVDGLVTDRCDLAADIIAQRN